ncbi:hypothetical protein Emag_007164 [Eimeria magna]
MLPAYSSQQLVERCREKRRGSESLAVEERESKRAACQTADGSAPADLEEGAAVVSQKRGSLNPNHQAFVSETPQAPSGRAHGSPPQVALARGCRDTPLRLAEQGPLASPLSLPQGKQTSKMDSKQHPHSHRKPEDVELAIEVLNDELADASPLDRPSLELATQTLMERLVEMRKRRPSDDKPSDSSAARKQSTEEYAHTLQAVLVGEGTQKYTLIRIPMQDDMSGDVYLVRGDPKAEYHYQTALETLNELQERNIMSDVTGGGRMDVLTSEKKVEIYGYSHQYGAADHSITAKMFRFDDCSSARSTDDRLKVLILARQAAATPMAFSTDFAVFDWTSKAKGKRKYPEEEEELEGEMEKVEEQLEELSDTKEEDAAHAATGEHKVRELAHKLKAKQHQHEEELNEEFEKRREAATAKKATRSGPQAAAAATPHQSTKQLKAGEAKPIECLPSTQAKISATPPKPQQAVPAATLEEVQRDIVEAEEEARRAEVEEASALSAEIEQEIVAAVAEAEACEASSQAATEAPQTTHATPVIKHVVVAPLPPPSAPVGEAKTAEAQEPQHGTATHQGESSPTVDGQMSPEEAASEEEEEEQREKQQEEEEDEQEKQEEVQEEEKEQTDGTAGGNEEAEADEEEEAETATTRQSRAERESAEAERAERTVGGTPQGRRPQRVRTTREMQLLARSPLASIACKKEEQPQRLGQDTAEEEQRSIARGATKWLRISSG